MNKILSAAAIAAATAATSWAVKRWLDTRSVQRLPKPPIESWENEGGALAPQHVPVESSQVPR
jgi:hypothetical protein